MSYFSFHKLLWIDNGVRHDHHGIMVETWYCCEEFEPRPHETLWFDQVLAYTCFPQASNRHEEWCSSHRTHRTHLRLNILSCFRIPHTSLNDHWHLSLPGM